jgi:TPR repeat protein
MLGKALNFEELIVSAEQGIAKAQNELALCYMLGCGTDIDTNEAVRWFTNAAEQGEQSAMANLGRCYLRGIGTEKNLEKAIPLLHEACELNVPQAQNDLGLCYEVGEGVVMDFSQAVGLFSKAAEQEYVEAYYNLGRYYMNGFGVEKNLIKALDLLFEASRYGFLEAKHFLESNIVIDELIVLAENGNAKAQYFLGCCYYEGRSVEHNLDTAIQWINKSAKQDNPLALFLLGYLCLDAGSLLLSEIMFEKAYKAGSFGASNQLEIVREKIAEQGVYFLVKITDEQWADKFMNGDIFMRCIEDFGIGKLFSQSTIMNESRGDIHEGLNASFAKEKTPFIYTPNNNDRVSEDGANIDEAWGVFDSCLQRRKIFCLYSLDCDAKNGWFSVPDSRLKDFGDTAVVILDSNEFLRRVTNRFLEKYGSAFWASYKRVSYNIDFSKNRAYSEFNKTNSYSWQREFRISLDLSEGRIAPKTLESMTDFAKFTFPGTIEIDMTPDSIVDSLVINIGNIRDICLKIPVDEFIDRIDKLIDNKYLPPEKVITMDVPSKSYPTFFRPIMRPTK